MVYGVGDLVHTVIEENRIPSLLRKNGYLLTIYDKPYEPCSNRQAVSFFVFSGGFGHR